ncbi:MAG: energy transducer TonB [Muribaculaceae bacterium]|nr:energy transducer TonB [Muribaculaceae bacterium]
MNVELDAEAVRVCKLLPKFTPGRQGGKAVAVSYALPINFKLNGNSENK